MKKHLLLVALFLTAVPVRAGMIMGKKVEYGTGKTVLKGYLAYPILLRGKRPGVLVVHEWWGQDAYARRRADMLAQMGYVALAVDMYGNGKLATHPEDAGAFSKAVFDDFETGKTRFNTALEFLKEQPNVDPERIAAIGYCFGGAVVLNMARAGADLKGVASFHGPLFAVKPAEAGAVKAKVLVCTGGDDMMVGPDQVEAFQKEMADANVPADVVVYPGAKHGFTNPDVDARAKQFNLPMAYNKKADNQSWKELKRFLKSLF